PPPRVEREHSMHAEATHAEGPRADVRSHVRPSPASTSDTGSGAFIPEDWDRTGFSMPAGDAPEPEPGGDDFFGATLAPGGGARSAAPITDAGGLSADAALSDLGRPRASAAPGRDVARPAPREDAARDDLAAVTRPPGAARPDLHRAADRSIDALLRAAGLDPASVDAETS